MKLVKESLNEINNFERSNDVHKTLDIGKDSFAAKELKFNELKNKYKFYLDYDHEENIKAKQKYIENIYDIEIFLNKLESLNIEIIDISGAISLSIEIRIFAIYDSNYSVAECISEEDANLFISIYKKLTLKLQDAYKIDKSSKYLYLYQKEQFFNWVDELEKFKKDIGINKL